MKNSKILFLMVFCSQLIACSKKGGSIPTPTSITLNTKEKLLVGHWQLKKVTDSILYTSGSSPTLQYETKYGNTDFIELNNKKEWAKYLESKIKDARIGGAGAAMGGTNTPSTSVVQDYVGWYYDESSQKMILNSVAYEVLSVSSSELVLWRSFTSGSYYTSYTAVYFK